MQKNLEWETKSILLEDWVTYTLEAKTDLLVSMELSFDPKGNFKITTNGRGKVYDWRLRAVPSAGYPDTYWKKIRLIAKGLKLYLWTKLTKLTSPEG